MLCYGSDHYLRRHQIEEDTHAHAHTHLFVIIKLNDIRMRSTAQNYEMLENIRGKHATNILNYVM